MADVDPVVETRAGKLRGTVVEGAAAFLSVPYGAPTDGENRFMPPRPPAPWAGVRDAVAFRTQAPQSRLGFPARPELSISAGRPIRLPRARIASP